MKTSKGQKSMCTINPLYHLAKILKSLSFIYNGSALIHYYESD